MAPIARYAITTWEDEQRLRDHLQAKLAKSEEAKKVQQQLQKDGAALAAECCPGNGPA